MTIIPSSDGYYDDDGGNYSRCSYCRGYKDTTTREQQYRTSFGIRSGTAVRGWPSHGGIFFLDDCVGVDLEFLQLDRFEPTLRSEDQAEEDAHCLRMRMLGAVWFDSEYPRELEDYSNLGDYPITSRRSDHVIAGYPSTGGAWVLRVFEEDGRSMGVGRIKNARNMEERCRVIQKLGGVFYEDPFESPELDLRHVFPDPRRDGTVVHHIKWHMVPEKSTLEIRQKSQEVKVDYD